MAANVNKVVPFTGINAQFLTPELADAHLIGANTAAAVGDVSLSWWNDKVQCGEAPKPVVRGTRCTRWRASEVADFWRRWAEQSPDDDTGKRAEIAKKASQAAASKRAAAKAAKATS